jgi:hypothetical protein
MDRAHQSARLGDRGHDRRSQKAALEKKRLPIIADIRHTALHKGHCAQALHVGPYDAEAPLLASLYNDYLGANRLKPLGLHHEIYLGDPRKTDPAKLKTILRQPVQPADRWLPTKAASASTDQFLREQQQSLAATRPSPESDSSWLEETCGSGACWCCAS